MSSAPRRNLVFPALMLLAGGMCLMIGALLSAGVGAHLHPLLASDGAGIVALVSGVALIGSASFPLVFARLTARDAAQDGDQ
ncbi:MAG: hypothetical protein KDE68_06485 [Rhodocyclaceae bacterium]|nr:hypothetical protein [Rhodocyclaceae bacterium]